MKKYIQVTIVAGALLLSSQLMAASIIFWDFENPVSSGSVSSFVPSTIDPSIAASASQTGGGPAEVFGGPDTVHLTRFFGPTNYPFITFTTTLPMALDSVTFRHSHNHNPGFPTNPSYDIQLQLDSGSGFVNVGALLNLSAANSGNTDTMNIGTLLDPGTYTLRWMSQNLAFGTDTNTEFFAMFDLTVNGALQREIPTLSFWSILLLALLLLSLGSWVVYRKQQ